MIACYKRRHKLTVLRIPDHDLQCGPLFNLAHFSGDSGLGDQNHVVYTPIYRKSIEIRTNFEVAKGPVPVAKLGSLESR